MPFRRRRNNGGRRNNRGNRGQNARGMVKSVSRQIQAVTPVRIMPKAQLLSVPSHNYQLKIRKFFRALIVIPEALIFDVTVGGIAAAVRAELGVATATGGESFAVHSARFYGADSVSSDLTVRVFDIEESQTTLVTSLVANFNDTSTSSGISHIAFFHPVNNRPTWNRNTTSSLLYSVQVTTASTGPLNVPTVVMDLDITYVRTPDENIIRIA
jgi:hypothetical protein